MLLLRVSSIVLLAIVGSASESISVHAQALLQDAETQEIQDDFNDDQGLEAESDHAQTGDDGSYAFSLDKFQELFDQDRDGRITFDEMKNALAVGSTDESEADKTALFEESGADYLSDVKKLFDQADTDKDGSLTTDEVARSKELQENLIIDVPDEVPLALIQEGENKEGNDDDGEDDELREHGMMLTQISEELVQEEDEEDDKVPLDKLREFLRHAWEGVSSNADTDEQKAALLGLQQGEVQNIHKALEAADTDHDGSLSAAEIQHADGLAEFLDLGTDDENDDHNEENDEGEEDEDEDGQGDENDDETEDEE